MNKEDVYYFIILTLCLVSGHFIRKLQNKQSRKWISTILGVIIIIYLSSWGIIFPLSLVLINAAIINIFRSCHVYSFFICFIHLILLRSMEFWGMAPLNNFLNTAQMLLTLKMIGVAYEVSATRVLSSKIEKCPSKQHELEYQYTAVNPSLLDLIHYSFNYIGLLTGPYFKFRTFSDFYNNSYCDKASCTKAAWSRFMNIPLYIGMFLLSDAVFPLSNLTQEEVYSKWSFWYKIFYMTPTFFTFRMRLCIGFVLAECICMSQGLGCYPSRFCNKPGKGPSVYLENYDSEEDSQDYDFETIHTLDVCGSEMAVTVREGMKCWNITVQYWLAAYVYRPLVQHSRMTRTLLTMMASAVWHGVYSGYYLCLLSVPFVLVVEDMCHHIIKQRLDKKSLPMFEKFWWALRMQWCAYLGLCFQLLRVTPIIEYWHAISYVGHLVIVALFVCCKFYTFIQSTSIKIKSC